MVVLSKIYTKTGDAGETALGDGQRVAKYSLRVDAYGGADETNATVGLLSRIQNDLFDLGADLCRPNMEKDNEAEYTPLRMTAAQTERLEAEIDKMSRIVELATIESVNEDAVKYVNRLSDWFFVASRIANNGGKDDVLWVPGANR